MLERPPIKDAEEEAARFIANYSATIDEDRAKK